MKSYTRSKSTNMSSATKPDDKILIDILTGASAGGMTATILAQKLMFETGCRYREAARDAIRR